MLDPLAHPLLSLSSDSVQWLVDQRVVTPGALGLFAGRVPSAKLPQSKAPAELERLGLRPALAADKNAAGWRTAVEVLASPQRRVSILTRELEEQSLSVFFVKDGQATLGVNVGENGSIALAPAFPVAMLCSALAQKLTCDHASTVALLPQVLGAFGRQFVAADRSLISRPEPELSAAFTSPVFTTFVTSGVLELSNGMVKPSAEYLGPLEAMWSGHSMIVEMRTGLTDEEHRILCFYGVAGRRLWSFDERLKSGQEVCVFKSLTGSEAAEVAGSIVGL